MFFVFLKYARLGRIGKSRSRDSRPTSATKTGRIHADVTGPREGPPYVACSLCAGMGIGVGSAGVYSRYAPRGARARALASTWRRRRLCSSCLWLPLAPWALWRLRLESDSPDQALLRGALRPLRLECPLARRRFGIRPRGACDRTPCAPRRFYRSSDNRETRPTIAPFYGPGAHKKTSRVSRVFSFFGGSFF